MSTLKKFITSCSLTFKAFDHEVNMTQNKATLWNFVAINKRGDKHYELAVKKPLSGKLMQVTVMLPVKGSFSATAPWDCDKTKMRCF